MPQPVDLSEARPGTAEAEGIYAYGVVRSGAEGERLDLAPFAGIAGAPLRLVTADGIAAIVSTLNLPGGTAALEKELEDPERAKSMILDHYRVLQLAVENCTVLPLRFGVVFAREAALVAALERHCDGFLEALARMTGAREWGVKIFCDHKALDESLRAESPALQAAGGSLAAAGQGRAFFMQRQFARQVEEETQRAIACCIDESRLRLREVVRAETALRIQPSSAHGRPDEMAWNGAVLVAKGGESDFFAVLEDLRRKNAARGFAFETGGPWPAFSFADTRLGEAAK